MTRSLLFDALIVIGAVTVGLFIYHRVFRK